MKVATSTSPPMLCTFHNHFIPWTTRFGQYSDQPGIHLSICPQLVTVYYLLLCRGIRQLLWLILLNLGINHLLCLFLGLNLPSPQIDGVVWCRLSGRVLVSKQWLQVRASVEALQWGTALCPWARHYHLLSTGSTQETVSQRDWKNVDWDVNNQTNQTKSSGRYNLLVTFQNYCLYFNAHVPHWWRGTYGPRRNKTCLWGFWQVRLNPVYSDTETS